MLTHDRRDMIEMTLGAFEHSISRIGIKAAVKVASLGGTKGEKDG